MSVYGDHDPVLGSDDDQAALFTSHFVKFFFFESRVSRTPLLLVLEIAHFTLRLDHLRSVATSLRFSKMIDSEANFIPLTFHAVGSPKTFKYPSLILFYH